MPGEYEPERAVEKRTTLFELRKLLDVSPEIFGDQLQTTQEAVEDAETEMEQRGQLSEITAEALDDLYRTFKPDSLR